MYVYRNETKNYYVYAPAEGSRFQGNIYVPKDLYPTRPEHLDITPKE